MFSLFFYPFFMFSINYMLVVGVDLSPAKNLHVLLFTCTKLYPATTVTPLSFTNLLILVASTNDPRDAHMLDASKLPDEFKGFNSRTLRDSSCAKLAGPMAFTSTQKCPPNTCIGPKCFIKQRFFFFFFFNILLQWAARDSSPL